MPALAATGTARLRTRPPTQPLTLPRVPYLQILPYLLLFVYFGSLARNLADIFTGKTGLGTNTTIVMAALRWDAVLACPADDGDRERAAKYGAHAFYQRLACLPLGSSRPHPQLLIPPPAAAC